MFFLPSLPLLGLRVRNPCQPWVCSWCDGGDSGSRRARLPGPRGQGGGLGTRPGRPVPLPTSCAATWVGGSLDLSPFPQSPSFNFYIFLSPPGIFLSFYFLPHPLPLSSKAVPCPVPSPPGRNTQHLVKSTQTWAKPPLRRASCSDVIIYASALPAKL